jgi:hypothetical protein
MPWIKISPEKGEMTTKQQALLYVEKKITKQEKLFEV